MLAKDLEKGIILYSVPIYIGSIDDEGNSTDPNNDQHWILETYEVEDTIEDPNYESNIVQVSTNPIIGCNDPYIAFPADFDLNNVIICYYGGDCTWAWTTNEQLAIEWFKRTLDITFFSELEFYIDEFFDIWKGEWRIDTEIIFA